MRGSEVHPTAIVEPLAVVGSGTSVWHHAHLRDGCRIGSDCVIGKNVYVDAGVEVGDGSRIQNNVSVYRGVTLGDRVFVGPSATFTNDRYPRADSPGWQPVSTRVEEGASIGAGATVVAGVTVAAWSVVGAGAVLTRSTRVHEVVAGNPARTLGWACRCGRVVSHDADPPPDDLDGCAGCHGTEAPDP